MLLGDGGLVFCLGNCVFIGVGTAFHTPFRPMLRPQNCLEFHIANASTIHSGTQFFVDPGQKAAEAGELLHIVACQTLNGCGRNRHAGGEA